MYSVQVHVHVYTVHVLYNLLVHVHVDDDYDEYGRSLEEDEPLSPHTAGETVHAVHAVSVVSILHSYDDLLCCDALFYLVWNVRFDFFHSPHSSVLYRAVHVPS